MVQAAFNTRFTKTTWKQLWAIRAVIMALQIKAEPPSVRWQLTRGWLGAIQMKDSVSCERVSVPSALLLHCYYSAQYKNSSAALLTTLWCNALQCKQLLHLHFKVTFWTWRNSKCYIKHFNVQNDNSILQYTESVPCNAGDLAHNSFECSQYFTPTYSAPEYATA